MSSRFRNLSVATVVLLAVRSSSNGREAPGRRSPVPLELTPVKPQVDGGFLPFVFDIALGVRRADTAFCASLDSILTRRCAEIRRLLDEYGAPRLDVTTGRPVS